MCVYSAKAYVVSKTEMEKVAADVRGLERVLADATEKVRVLSACPVWICFIANGGSGGLHDCYERMLILGGANSSVKADTSS